MNQKIINGHEVYTDADQNKPESILDRNGQVCLALCKNCGAAEIDLEEPCRDMPLEIFEELYGEDISIEAAELGDISYETILERKFNRYLEQHEQNQTP